RFRTLAACHAFLHPIALVAFRCFLSQTPAFRYAATARQRCWRGAEIKDLHGMTARILIVDDVPANTRLLEAKLSAEYYQVASARDGFEALRMAAEWQPDMILLDVMMPGMDGYECCRKLK